MIKMPTVFLLALTIYCNKNVLSIIAALKYLFLKGILSIGGSDVK